jgi:hypothetical protein
LISINDFNINNSTDYNNRWIVHIINLTVDCMVYINNCADILNSFTDKIYEFTDNINNCIIHINNLRWIIINFTMNNN